MDKTVRLYFDLDDTLNLWSKFITETYGIEFPTGILPDADFKEFRDHLYANIDADGPTFWLSIPANQPMIDLFRGMYAAGIDVQVLTAVPKHVQFGTPEFFMIEKCKKFWCSLVLGDSVRVHITHANLKHHWFDPTIDLCILVDDSPDNGNKWDAMGGKFIQFTGDALATENLLVELILDKE